MTTMTLPNSRTADRLGFRDAAARLRANAGVDHPHTVAAVNTVAEVGAAARRLRASNIWDEPTPCRVPTGVDLTGRAQESTALSSSGDVDDEPIVFIVNVPAMIYLESQVDQRDSATVEDRDLRRNTLAERAAQLLADLDAVKQSSRR